MFNLSFFFYCFTDLLVMVFFFFFNVNLISVRKSVYNYDKIIKKKKKKDSVRPTSLGSMESFLFCFFLDIFCKPKLISILLGLCLLDQTKKKKFFSF